MTIIPILVLFTLISSPNFQKNEDQIRYLEVT